MVNGERMEHYPFTSFYSLVGLGLFYIAMIQGLQAWMRNRKEFTNLRSFTIVHNILMTLGSLAMFLGITYELALIWSRYNYDPSLAVCDTDEVLRTPGVDFWFYIFYMSKYVEYIDNIC